MKLEQCLAALRALPNTKTHFVMPFRLLPGYEQTREVLAATENEFWELLATKKIKSIDVNVADKIFLFDTDLYEFRMKLDNTLIRDVRFIVDGEFYENNIKTIRKVTTGIISEPGQEHVWQFIIKNLFRSRPEFVFKQLSAKAPVEMVYVMLRPTFSSEPGAMQKDDYEKKLVAELARVKPTYIALSLNGAAQGLNAAELHHVFELFALAGCYQIDLNLKGLPPQAQKLVTTIAHEMMEAVGSPWQICAIKRDHVARFQTQVRANYRNSKKIKTPEGKGYRLLVENGLSRPAKLKQEVVSGVEPDLTNLFAADESDAKGLSKQAQKLVTASASHEGKVKKYVVKRLFAIKHDHEKKMQTEAQANFRSKINATTPERKGYRLLIKSGLFRSSKLKHGEVISQEPDLANFFAAYLN